MSTATFQEPLRAVSPHDEIKEKFTAALTARTAAARAFDAIMAAPRKAAGYLGQLVTALHLQRPVGWFVGATRWLRGQSEGVARLGRAGTASAVVAVATSSPGRRILGLAGHVAGRVVRWAARAVYCGVDGLLRLFGSPGNRIADRLFDLTVQTGARLSAIAGPVVHRVARLTDPQALHVRILAGLSRSHLGHRLLRTLVSNRYLRWALESVVVPLLVDSGLYSRLKALVRTGMARVRNLRRQRTAMTVIQPAPAVIDVDVIRDYEDTTWPEPGNRAERRAMQREQARQKHHPRTS